MLVGGLRVLNANTGHSSVGVLTSRPETLTNDFFVAITDSDLVWNPQGTDGESFEGVDRASGAKKWDASRVDLAFGSNSELRALSEVYASDDASEKFVHDFVAAWTKVMMNDRFDVR